MPTSPTPADRPADQLRAAAECAPGPELARLLTTLADASDHHGPGEGGVVATLVHPALAVARQLLGTSVCPECGTSGACNGGPCPLTAAEPGCAMPGFMDCDCDHVTGCQHPAAPPAHADRAATLRDAADEPTRSYRLEHRHREEDTWRPNTPGIGANWSWQSREKADQRLAEARTRWPDFEHRLIETTTTVTEQPAAPAAPEEPTPAARVQDERLACPDHGLDGCEADDHMEPPTVNGEVI
ncbi:hypothetical protein ACWF76_05810 [Streptomyces globisporus]